MRLLADECFDERLAARLRDAGHDVARVPAQSGLDDLAVAQHAQQEDRVLLTQDTDFGRIALRHGQPRTGVVILRASGRQPRSRDRAPRAPYRAGRQ